MKTVAPSHRPPATCIAGIHLGALGGDIFFERPRLLEALAGTRESVVELRAPAGYGKSVLLAQWAVRDPRPFASISLGPRHDDPAAFLAAVIEALEGVEPVSAELTALLQVPELNLALADDRLSREMEGRTVPMVLVIDELEIVESEETHRLLSAIARTIGNGSQLAVASRGGGLRQAARLRAGQRLAELGSNDLAMTKGECEALLKRVGLDLPPAQSAAVIGRAEGWPGALYLAALALRREDDIPAAISHFAGDDRFIVDYIREEFLARASPDRVAFLTRASILDRLCGSLCDAVLERTGSTTELRDLAAMNMLVIPLDRSDEWFRLHSLLADMLRTELARTAPTEVPGLHLRASRWWHEHGDLPRAIEHAIEGEDLGRAAELLWEAVPVYNSWGQSATLRHWLERIGLERVSTDPRLSLIMAQVAVLRGEGGAAQEWNRTSRELIARDPAAYEGTTLLGTLALVDGTLARDGVEGMLAGARAGAAALPSDSLWWSWVWMLEGIGLHLRGEHEPARQALSESARHAAHRGVPIIQVTSLAQLALLDAGAGDWDRALMLASQARAQIDRSGLEEQPTIAGVLAISAFVKSHELRSTEATADLRLALSLFERTDEFGTWYVAQTHAAAAAAALALDDLPLAKRLAAEARRIDPPAIGAPALDESLEHLEAQIDGLRASPVGDLTPAELRVLRLLPTHLPFAKIAAELYISPNTVKTQAQSVYRKLGVRARSEAVEAAAAAGLLDD